MTEFRNTRYFVVLISIVLSIILTVMPVFDFLVVARPLWIGLVLAYWALVVPVRAGMLTAWVVGIAVDILTGTLLGQNALVLCFISFSVLALQSRLRVYHLWQQSLFLFIIFSISQCLNVWLDHFSGNNVPLLTAQIPAVVSALLWPWVYIILHRIHQSFGSR